MLTIILVLIYVVILGILFMCKAFTLSTVLTTTIMYFVSVWVLTTTHVIGASKGTQTAEKEKQKFKEQQRNAAFVMWVLKNCETAANSIGVPPSDTQLFEWQFCIDRLFNPIESINRKIKAVELIGICRMITFAICFVCAWVFLYTVNVIPAMVAITSFLVQPIVRGFLKILIDEQDKELEHDFPELYLLLYCELRRGTNSRIAPSLQDYMRSCNALYAPTEHAVIRRFVLDLQNNIEVYSDESEALVHMREKYKSALIVNFCNLATQSLRGVDTDDKLMAFKIELQAKQKDMMEREAHARVELGRKSLIMVYFILFQFIALSWAAKLVGNGTVSGFFGLGE